MIEKNTIQNRTDDSRVCLVGIGGAGAKSASEIAKDMPMPMDAVLVDRHPDELRRNHYGTKIPIGYPLYAATHGNRNSPQDLVDETDLLRVRAALNGFKRVYVVMGLGGQATLELAPSVIKVARDVVSNVVVISTMPFAFEGPMRRKVAETALDRIDAEGCAVAVADADSALSGSVGVGNVAEELTKTLARTLMTLLTAETNAGVGALNGATTTLETIRKSSRIFVGHGVADSVEQLRRAARDAVKNPLTTGLTLSEADVVNLTIAVPADMPVKSLNAVMGTIERELVDDVHVATSFVPLAKNATKVRVSVVAGGTHRDDETKRETNQLQDGGVEFHPLDPDAAVEAAEMVLTASQTAHRSQAIESDKRHSVGVLI